MANNWQTIDLRAALQENDWHIVGIELAVKKMIFLIISMNLTETQKAVGVFYLTLVRFKPSTTCCKLLYISWINIKWKEAERIVLV